MLKRIGCVLSVLVLVSNAPEALAACLPDPPSDDDAVVCDGNDSTGYDGSGATRLTVTTNGVTVLTDADPTLDSAILVGDDNTVTIGADATIDVTEVDGFGIRGGDGNVFMTEAGAQINVLQNRGTGIRAENDNFFDSMGTISIFGTNGRGLSLGENTTGVLPNGAVNRGTIFAIGNGSYAVETGLNSGVANLGVLEVMGDDSRGLSADSHLDPTIAANITNTLTINVSGDDAYGIKAGDGWTDGTVDLLGRFTPTAAGIRNNAGATIAVTGARSYGIFAGDETNTFGNNNSFVSNGGTMTITGTGATGVSLGGNSFNRRFDFAGGMVATLFDFENTGTITGGPDSGPLVEFRTFRPFFENRVRVTATGQLLADLTNLGTANRGIALRGSDGDEFLVNLGTIQGRIDFNGGNDRYVHNSGAVFNGTLSGGTGIDQLALIGTMGSMDLFDVSLLSEFEQILIAGGGGWELSNATDFNGLIEVDASGQLLAPTPLVLSDGDDIFVNRGEVQGIVALGGGNDRYDHSQGAMLNGSLQGGAGTDLLVVSGAPGTMDTFDVSSTTDFEQIVITGGTEWELLNASGFGGLIEVDTSGFLRATVPLVLSSTDDILVNRGQIQGDIEFGDGDDEYYQIPGATLTGTLVGGPGSDELILAGGAGLSDSFDVAALSEFEAIQITGGAGWELTNTAGYTGLTQVGSNGLLQIPSPITLDGDLEVLSTGTIEATLDGGATPPLTIQGASTFDGTLLVQADAALLPSMTPYRVALANGGYSGRLSVTPRVGLNRFTPIWDASGLLVIYQQGLVAVASGPSQRSIAEHLDAVDAAGGASPDLQALIDSFETSTGDLSKTLRVLNPEAYDVQTQIVVEGGRRVANLLIDRPRDCKTGMPDPWGEIDSQLPCHPRAWAPWVAALGGFRSRDGFSDHPRYDSQMGGLAAGIDWRPLESVDLTFAVSSQRGSVDVANAGESTLTLTDVSGYAAWSLGPVRTQGVVSWGHGFHQDHRLIRASESDYPLNSRGNEDHDSDRITLAAEIGTVFELGQFELEPVVGVDWAWVYQRSIHESGAGGFGIRIDDRDDSVGSVNAGLRLSTTYRHDRYLIHQLEWMDGIWKPSLEVRWRQMLSGDQRDIDARFQGSPDTVPDFQISGEEDDGGAEIGLGVTFTPTLANRLQFDLRYDAYVGENTLEQDLVARVVLGF